MAQQRASRDIRKHLASIVRNDWDWPPNQDAAADGTKPNVRAHAFDNFEIKEYRDRYYGTTDDDITSDEDENEDASSDWSEDGNEKEEVYKFDNPDAIGGLVQAHARRRKKRRKARLEMEMRYNASLRCFVERRNAWTAAKPRGEGSSSIKSESILDIDGAAETNGDEKEKEADQEDGEAAEDDSSDAVNSSADKTTSHADHGSDTRREKIVYFEGPLPDADPLIPIPPPLVSPTNPVRAAITRKTYPEIYSKIVQSARTPTTPINLADMTRALVQGWKDNGEWPPRPSGLEASAGGQRRGGRAASGWRSARDAMDIAMMDAAREERARAEHSIGLGEGLLAHHPHFKRGVEGVKRVFRLSGGGSVVDSGSKTAMPDAA